MQYIKKTIVVIPILVVLVVTGCSYKHLAKRTYADKTCFAKIKNDISDILNEPIFSQTLASIKVVSLNDNSVIFEHNSKLLMHPASNMKLITSAAALAILDTNYQFNTELYIEDYDEINKTCKNLYLKGYGDPDLTLLDIDSLAEIVKNYGLKTVLQDIIVDDSFFDDTRWGNGWMWDDESDPDAPHISPLSVNKNCVNVILFADNQNTFVYTEPMTEFVLILNNTKLANNTTLKKPQIKLVYQNEKNYAYFDGEISPFQQWKKKVSLREPALFTGTIFKEALRSKFIVVYGKVTKGTIQANARKIYNKSRSICEVLNNMNKNSDNLSAENILKVLGANKYGVPGTSRNGIFAINRFLDSIGLDTTKLMIADGSGVSRYNLISAEQIVQFLVNIYKHPKIFLVFYNSLPIASIDGTLSNRMIDYENAQNVRAKTGTLNGVSCLSGYIKTIGGEMLAFAIMMQNFIGPVEPYLKAQDKICNILCKLNR